MLHTAGIAASVLLFVSSCIQDREPPPSVALEAAVVQSTRGNERCQAANASFLTIGELTSHVAAIESGQPLGDGRLYVECLVFRRNATGQFGVHLIAQIDEPGSSAYGLFQLDGVVAPEPAVSERMRVTIAGQGTRFQSVDCVLRFVGDEQLVRPGRLFAEVSCSQLKPGLSVTGAARPCDLTATVRASECWGP